MITAHIPPSGLVYMFFGVCISMCAAIVCVPQFSVCFWVWQLQIQGIKETFFFTFSLERKTSLQISPKTEDFFSKILVLYIFVSLPLLIPYFRIPFIALHKLSFRFLSFPVFLILTRCLILHFLLFLFTLAFTFDKKKTNAAHPHIGFCLVALLLNYSIGNWWKWNIKRIQFGKHAMRINI